jgi:hypothetical protein
MDRKRLGCNLILILDTFPSLVFTFAELRSKSIVTIAAVIKRLIIMRRGRR